MFFLPIVALIVVVVVVVVVVIVVVLLVVVLVSVVVGIIVVRVCPCSPKKERIMTMVIFLSFLGLEGQTLSFPEDMP